MKLYYGLTESMLEASMIARKGREMGLSYGEYEAKYPTKSAVKKDNRILRVCKVCRNKFEPPRKKRRKYQYAPSTLQEMYRGR